MGGEKVSQLTDLLWILFINKKHSSSHKRASPIHKLPQISGNYPTQLSTAIPSQLGASRRLIVASQITALSIRRHDLRDRDRPGSSIGVWITALEATAVATEPNRGLKNI